MAEQNQQPKNSKPVRSESEEYAVRSQKLQTLRDDGKDPFTQVRFDRTNYTTDIIEHYDEMEGKVVRLAGRMMSKRVMGKMSFSDMSDRYGRIQLVVRRDVIGEDEYKAYKKLLNSKAGIKKTMKIKK